MDTSLEKELLRYAGLLPKKGLKELVAFAKWLSIRNTSKEKDNSINYELHKLDIGEAAHLEEEFVDYRKQYPRE